MTSFRLQKDSDNQAIAAAAVRHIQHVYGQRATQSEAVPVDADTDEFVRASTLLKTFEASHSAQSRTALLNYLGSTSRGDADCAALLFQFAVGDGDNTCTFAQLVTLGMDSLALAQHQHKFHAEVRAVFAIAQLLLDRLDTGEQTIEICTAVLPKLRNGMDAEDLYDMWCLTGRAAEFMVLDGDESYRKIEIKAYSQARSIAQRLFPDNLYAAACLLPLRIGREIGSGTDARRTQVIVDDLQPLRILAWLDSDGVGARDEEFPDTLGYIWLCMVHEHVPSTHKEWLALQKRVWAASDVSEEIRMLWL